ncbi:MAG: replication-associated recombination protein A [Phycisphaeraceae bacterium]|nr:MAG: replication-associated recombination protein A [Phycisphaeraceae bacterium]
MRPRTLDEFRGQRHILGHGDETDRPLLRRMIESGSLTSIILHGPPGTGKTTLARVIANTTDRYFVSENASSVGVKRIREIIDEAVRRIESAGRRTILFLDEIHRFSRSQQDVLLEDVEKARITLVGATTENPLFAVNSALVSRSTLFRLEPLSVEDIREVVTLALSDRERGYGDLKIDLDDDALNHWATMSEGDARRALNALEVAVKSACEDGTLRAIRIDLAAAQDSIQRKAILYDRAGDQHYDHASAFIKSLRGSDPDAALYWLALMLEAGEDPRFIARRLAILASEDIGNADPQAIVIADAAWSLVERIGMPEARITLAQCVTYLALAPKSNASYMAIEAASEDVRTGSTVPVPIFLRDKTKARSHDSPEEGRGYKYSHASETRTSIGGVTEQQYLGVEKRYYHPGSVGQEAEFARRLKEVLAARNAAKEPESDGGPRG